MQEPLRPIFCLIIEDNPLVGLDLAEAQDASGYYVAGPFPVGKDASEWLARFTPDVAVVDLTLKDGSCVEVIRGLQAQAVPVIIYSACSPSQNPFDALAGVPWLVKPAPMEAIETALRMLLCTPPI
jgi:DNA-binding response OmpR family regulator